MNITPIRDLLRENNVEYPNLALLQPNEALYTALLVQPEAQIRVRDDFIGNADHASALSKFEAIAKEAHAQSVELLVTPEYSFPWDAIENLLKEGVVPQEGQLWVLGCESLLLTELPNLKARFAQWAEVLHEPIAGAQSATARYLNPLVYLFHSRMSDSKEPKLVMVVQFKTCPSGDAKNIEATGMARGKDVYLFGHNNEVRLMTLICSDAFEFSDEEIKEHYEHLLLLHIQLNEKPRDEAYMRYRRNLYRYGCETTELICLNWAENITYFFGDDATGVHKNNISASSWHSTSKKFDTEDKHIEHNHAYGAYYSLDATQKRHVLHFTYKPAVFRLQTTKVRHHGVDAAKSRRRGPEQIQIYCWDSIAVAWRDVTPPVDDGFVSLAESYGEDLEVLNGCHAISPLSVERLVCITNGKLGPSQNWHEATELQTMRLENRADVMQRITVTIDPDGSAYRDQCLRTMKALANIPPANLPLPSHLSDFKNGYCFSWKLREPHCNVISNNSKEYATFIYAGEGCRIDEIDNLYGRAYSTTYPRHQSDKICVFYREGNDIKRYDPPNAKAITRSGAATGKDFRDPR